MTLMIVKTIAINRTNKLLNMLVSLKKHTIRLIIKQFIKLTKYNIRTIIIYSHSTTKRTKPKPHIAQANKSKNKNFL